MPESSTNRLSLIWGSLRFDLLNFELRPAMIESRGRSLEFGVFVFQEISHLKFVVQGKPRASPKFGAPK
jgi:hypothetical protein